MNILEFFDQLIIAISNPAQDIAFAWMMMGWFYSFGFFIYVLFALMVIRQIQMMSQTFSTPLRNVLLLFAVGHLCIALGVLVMAFANLV